MSGPFRPITSPRRHTRPAADQDLDLFDMAVLASTADLTYQAALQTTADVRQLSLLEFLS